MGFKKFLKKAVSVALPFSGASLHPSVRKGFSPDSPARMFAPLGELSALINPDEKQGETRGLAGGNLLKLALIAMASKGSIPGLKAPPPAGTAGATAASGAGTAQQASEIQQFLRSTRPNAGLGLSPEKFLASEGLGNLIQPAFAKSNVGLGGLPLGSTNLRGVGTARRAGGEFAQPFVQNEQRAMLQDLQEQERQRLIQQYLRSQRPTFQRLGR